MRQGDAQVLTQSRGVDVVSLGVDQRHGPQVTREALLEGHVEQGGQPFFERGMAILVERAEKDDTGAVDVEESYRHVVGKRHD